MSTRADLLELSLDALTALSNPGFVKRAQKDVAEGKLPEIEEQPDGSVIARYSDGTVTTLAPGKPLRQASCTCPATGLCRHRVTLVLAYQAQAQAHAGDALAPEMAPWCPSQLAEAVLAMPRATLEQARRLAGARPVITLSAGVTPTARLPMCDVRFLSRTSLALARCDCQQGGNCAHVAIAVWAFAQAQRRQGDFASMTLELDLALDTATSERSVDPAAHAAEALVAALAERLWLDGTGQDPLSLEAPFEQALQAVNRLGWRWVAEALDQLRQAIAGQHARASGADPASVLHLLCALTLRLAAALACDAEAAPAIPARQILGIGVKGEVALDHLRLVPLGSICTMDDVGDSVRMIWADSDTMSITVLEKRWPKSAGAPALRDRRLLGMSLHRLGASQVVTKAAKRHANGSIVIGSAATQTSALPVASTVWDNLAAPLRQPDLQALREHMASLAPDFVRPLQAIEHVHVLALGAVVDCTWNGASQTLSANVQVGDSGTLLLQLRYDKAAPGAIDALAAVLAGEQGTVLAVAGSVGVSAGLLRMTPLAVLTTQGLCVPQLAATSTARTMSPGEAPKADAVHALLDNVSTLLAHCLRQGLRHQGRAALDRVTQYAQALRDAGMARSADALGAAFETIKGTPDSAGVARRMAALHALLELLAAD